ncbi:MAG: hypothetical protein WAL51_04220, partial [Candidatus Acidiferrales bacterium]
MKRWMQLVAMAALMAAIGTTGALWAAQRAHDATQAGGGQDAAAAPAATAGANGPARDSAGSLPQDSPQNS